MILLDTHIGFFVHRLVLKTVNLTRQVRLLQNPFLWRSDGTGRHNGLKIRGSFERVGSIPIFAIIEYDRF